MVILDAAGPTRIDHTAAPVAVVVGMVIEVKAAQEASLVAIVSR
jgi:hypothetical protein